MYSMPQEQISCADIHKSRPIREHIFLDVPFNIELLGLKLYHYDFYFSWMATVGVSM